MNGAQDTDKARLNERERDLAWACSLSCGSKLEKAAPAPPLCPDSSLDSASSAARALRRAAAPWTWGGQTLLHFHMRDRHELLKWTGELAAHIFYFLRNLGICSGASRDCPLLQFWVAGATRSHAVDFGDWGFREEAN